MLTNALKKEAALEEDNLYSIVDWALRGLDLNKDTIIEKVSSMYSKEMLDTNTNPILIAAAIELTTVKEPNWKIAAARFLVKDLYRQASENRAYDSNLSYDNYFKFLKLACEKGLYNKDIFDLYSEDELKVASTFIKPEYDLEFDYAGMNLLAQRYLLNDRGKVFELPQEAFLTIALWLASSEKSNRLEFAKKVYEAIASRKISLATPILINLRRTQGNLSSCFISAMDDSLESILYNVETVGKISKNGGGVGVNISRVRATGATISNNPGASGGVIPWIKIINDTAVAVNQLGKRAGAVTVALDVWHLDIESFLELQTENGDQRKKAYDIFPQVVIPDLFMKRVNFDMQWTLFDPYEIRAKFGIELAELWGEKFEEFYLKIEKDENIELKKVIRAKDLMKSIMKSTIETGMPYMFFKDTANRTNPNQHDGLIGSGNLCQESFSNFKPSKVSKQEVSKETGQIIQKIEGGYTHTCNLTSINLGIVLDKEELKEICKLVVRVLDNTIDLTTTPIGESYFHNNRYRTIGVGALGLADYLAYYELMYNKAANEVDKLFEFITYNCIKESVKLAKERGKYSQFEGSEWSKGIILGKDKKWFEKNSDMSEEWSNLIDEMRENGIRNSQIMAIAPNTSTALLQGCTPSILPVYNKFFIDKNSKGAVPICPIYIKDKFWYYAENKNLNQKEVVEVVSRIQKWIDQGISFEMVFNLNHGITAKDMYETYFEAWAKGCKTIYYIRTIQQDSSEAAKREECVSCAN